MRFPHELYSKMVEQEERLSSAQHVAKRGAAEKKVVSESAIDDESEEEVLDEIEEPEDDLVD